jgi:8-oxo-dGTP pyrophosphatase MutT (NUDIX family)
MTERVAGRLDHIKTPSPRMRAEQEKAELEAISREAAEQTKVEIKAMLARAAKLGTSAYNVAIALLGSDLSMDEIIEACEKVPTEESTDIHRARQGTFTTDRRQFEREPTKPEEEAWLRQAREEAESAWAKMFPQSAPKRDTRTPEEVALHGAFGELAQRAAGLIRNEDNQKIYRHNQIDETDIDLYQRGAAAAKRLWPGR